MAGPAAVKVRAAGCRESVFDDDYDNDQGHHPPTTVRICYPSPLPARSLASARAVIS